MADVRPNFHFPEKLHNDFKKVCCLKNVSMQQIIIKLVKKWVGKEQGKF